jgi:hypothetical protein
MSKEKVLLYGVIDAPSPPDWMLGEAQKLSTKGKNVPGVMNNHGDEFTKRLLYKDGKSYINSFNWSASMSEDALIWARQNIAVNAKDVRSVNTVPGLERNGPHVDRSRNITLIYLLETGGSEHQTVFSREKGHKDLIRPWGTHVDHYDRLEELVAVRLKLNRWNLLYGGVLHSIENISEGRFNIQVSLDFLPTDIKVDMGVYI